MVVVQGGMARAGWTCGGVVALVLSAACSGDPATDVEAGGGAPTVSTQGAELYRGTIAVLEDGDGSPQLCQGMLDSMPPQCDGVAVSGWSWAVVDGEETYGDVTWGTFEVTVTEEGEALTLVSAGPPGAPSESLPEPDYSTPCPEPDGGWATTVDRSRLALADFTAFGDYLGAAKDISATWVDNSTDPKFDPDDLGSYVFDPAAVVTNIRFVSDAPRHEREIRAIWGGPICVLEGGVARSELGDLVESISAEDDHGGGGYVDEVRGRVVLTPLLEDPALEQELRARYDPIEIAFEPVLRLVQDG